MKQIVVKPVSAFLTHNTELFTKMDPYCLCILGQQKQRTKTNKEAGARPAWGDILVFNQPLVEATLMKVQVWDSDPTFDDLVGEGSIDTGPIFNTNGKTFNEIVCLYYKGVPAGEAFIEIEVRTIHQEGQDHLFPGIHNPLNYKIHPEQHHSHHGSDMSNQYGSMMTQSHNSTTSQASSTLPPTLPH